MQSNHKTNFILHRFGFTKEKKIKIGNKNYLSEQQSFARAYETLKNYNIVAAEIDLSFTIDNVAVVCHKDIKSTTFNEFKIKYPHLGTFNSWILWLNSIDFFKNHVLYIDIKSRKAKEIDYHNLFKFLESNSTNPENIYLGSRDLGSIFEMLSLKRITKSPLKISFQIPLPLFPHRALKRLNKGVENFININDIIIEKYDLHRLRPDAFHFFFPDNIFKAIRMDQENHDDYVQFADWLDYYVKSLKLYFEGKVNTDIKPHLIPDKILGFYFKRSSGPQVYPNILFLTNIALYVLKKFTQTAQDLGYKVFSGTTNSRLTINRMISWKSLDYIMVDNPDYFRDFIDPSIHNLPKLNYPTDQFAIGNNNLLKSSEEVINIESSAEWAKYHTILSNFTVSRIKSILLSIGL